jgi:hypothetical protein
LNSQLHADDLAALSLAEATPLLPLSEAARAYAEPSFQPGRYWMSAVMDLMHRIHHDFEFEAGVTTVSTSVDEVLQQRRGVCQDFAHLMLACLRAHGLPARYVSGYLLTEPPEGQPRLMGVDASHAWVAAYARLDRVRPHQQSTGRHALHHLGLGCRLRRRGAAAWCDLGRWQSKHAGAGERSSWGLIYVACHVEVGQVAPHRAPLTEDEVNDRRI